MSSSPDPPAPLPSPDFLTIGPFTPYNWRYTEPDGSFVYLLETGMDDQLAVPDPATAARILFMINLVIVARGDPVSLIGYLQRLIY